MSTNGVLNKGTGAILFQTPAATVSQGGTGQNSLTAHAILVGNGTSAVSLPGLGTSGQLMTSNGSSSDPSMQDPITATNGETTLGSTYGISIDNGSYEDTGLSVTLPSSGTYLVWFSVRSNINATTTAGAYILLEMYNSTDSVAITNSEKMGAYATTTSASYYMQTFVQKPITVAASKVIHLYAKTIAPASTSVRNINSDTNGRTSMGYVKVGN